MKNLILKKLLAIGISTAVVMLSCTAALADETEETITEETETESEAVEEEIPSESDELYEEVSESQVTDESMAVSSGVDINSTNFPDDNFRSYVSNSFDTDYNGVLSTDEICLVNNMNVSHKNISDLKGIEFFSSMTWLFCGENQLTSLDLSNNTKLIGLHCESNQLNSINISNNPNLIAIICRDNQLTDLDLRGCPSLVSLHCNNNHLTSLNVSGCSELEELCCDCNYLTSLDLSGCITLDHLNCCQNQITSLDIRNTPRIEEAYFAGENPDCIWWTVPSTAVIYEGYNHSYCRLAIDRTVIIISSNTNNVSMYRLYNPNSGEHFYTSSEGERDMLVSVGWNYEAVGWIAPSTSNTPVYRLYNENGGEHHYTTSVAERDMLVSLGWNDEGIGWYSDDAQTVPLYRQYNPNAFANNHNYTTSLGENDWLVSIGWQAEGIGWYGIG